MPNLLKPGQIFADRYRIERFVAQGGYGAVYAAEQTATELTVAIKVLWPHVLESGKALEKFQLEARLSGRINSEYIVKVLDAGFDATTEMPFMAMELLDGEDLQRHVERLGPLPAEAVAAFMQQIATALDKAHGYVDRDGRHTPIVHRDLKPENLFIARRESGNAVIKILDFGIAKVLNQSTAMSRDIKGTPLYMACEQVTAAPVTPRTDVWALGLIAFFMLSGKSYWRSAQAEGELGALFGEILTLPLEPASLRLSSFRRPVPWREDFDAWFARCVNRDPELRFASAGQAVAALSKALGVATGSVGSVYLGARLPPSFTPDSTPSSVPISVSTASSSPMVEGPTLVSAQQATLALSPTTDGGSGAAPRTHRPLAFVFGVMGALFAVGATTTLLLRARAPEPLPVSETNPSSARPAAATGSESELATASALPSASQSAGAPTTEPSSTAASSGVVPRARPPALKRASKANPPKSGADLYDER